MNDLPKLANSFPCYAVSKHRLSLVLLETNSYRYFTCSQLPGLQKPSLLVLKSENVLVAQDPTTTTATRARHQKSKRFNMQNNIFARAPYLFCLFFSRLRRENFMFYEGRKLATTNLPFSFWTWTIKAPRRPFARRRRTRILRSKHTRCNFEGTSLVPHWECMSKTPRSTHSLLPYE